MIQILFYTTSNTLNACGICIADLDIWRWVWTRCRPPDRPFPAFLPAPTLWRSCTWSWSPPAVRGVPGPCTPVPGARHNRLRKKSQHTFLHNMFSLIKRIACGHITDTSQNLSYIIWKLLVNLNDTNGFLVTWVYELSLHWVQMYILSIYIDRRNPVSSMFGLSGTWLCCCPLAHTPAYSGTPGQCPRCSHPGGCRNGGEEGWVDILHSEKK